MDKSKSIRIWEEFREKLEHDTFTAADFSAEMCAYLQPFLCGEHSAFRRQKYLNAPYDIYKSVKGMSVISHCADDDYRFDFVSDGILWKLTFIECITLPVYDMDMLPYSEFVPLEKKELHIRRENSESKCEMIIYNHIWRTIYFTVGHLKPVIEYPEYMELFEAIWKDRAVNAGWNIEFAYTDTDTSLIFKHISRKGELK